MYGRLGERLIHHLLQVIQMSGLSVSLPPGISGEKFMQQKFGDKLNVFRSDPYYVEVLPKFTDKGVAVDKLMKHLDIKKEKVICVGDSYNDLPMLKRAGLAVAMGNAQASVKEAADIVTDTNDEDGIAKIVEKFMTEVPQKEEENTDL